MKIEDCLTNQFSIVNRQSSISLPLPDFRFRFVQDRMSTEFRASEDFQPNFQIDDFLFKIYTFTP